MSETLDTTKQANGPLSVEYYAADAAQPANVAAPIYHVEVDNSPVSLILSGPTQALTTEGPQSISATATAGPSGVSGIACAVDGSPPSVRSGSSEDLRVSNLGLNTVRCYGQNNAVNAAGLLARSPLSTWTVDIRRPAVSLISVVHVADALRCVRKRLHIHVPAHWTRERVDGHRVRVHVPAQNRRIRIVRCHPRTKVVVLHRDGKTLREHVVQLPHRVSGAKERSHFGAKPLVAGWLGAENGDALPGQLVDVMAAPKDGLGQFRLLARVRTRPNGTWSAHLPAGPSRLIEAAFNGSSRIAPATSRAATITVHASARLHVSPRKTHWGDTVQIYGHLRGGYIPKSGELVVLKIGWHGGSAEIGHVYTDSSGKFSADYTFLRGTGIEHYRIWAQTARETDYPFAPSSSKRVPIEVSSS